MSKKYYSPIYLFLTITSQKISKQLQEIGIEGNLEGN